MNQPLYLKRTLVSDDQRYTEASLLKASKYIIVLAEPGAGKTELIKSLAKQLTVKEVTANVFRHRASNQSNKALVIDAFDELSKIDQSGIYQLLANASEINPSHIVISSRSSEWNTSTTNMFEEFFGKKPVIARLCEFNESEQQNIFFHHTSQDDFVEFKAEVTRFSLDPLLPNPQFLKLFADAYIESNGHFTDKRSIFTQAITHLAKETNQSVRPSPKFSTKNKVDISSEIFAKILLSGSEGVGISEVNESRMYPILGSLLNTSDLDVSSLLATRLFKPGDNIDQHRPVHKIVAEYCAADYLVKRILMPSDPLTISQCVSIIAPNLTVRDELRGLLGWMASLGNKLIEETIIELDPYAVLANGDPSQLEPSSKRLLLSKLKEIEASDPYFRRNDAWRKFNVVGFFTHEVIEDLKPIISGESDGNLRDLLLELLAGTKELKWLEAELRQIILDPNENKNTRMLANTCALGLDAYDFHSDLKHLIVEGTYSSLAIAADIIKYYDPEKFTSTELEDFFNSCANLYPSYKKGFERTIGRRYFINGLVSCLSLQTTEALLNSLSKGLACTCGKRAFECDCRTGISKIIGHLLDRYFEVAKPPHDPLQIWQWVKSLNFHGRNSTRKIASVNYLREDNCLRQGIITHVFGELTDRKQISQTRWTKFTSRESHAGLAFKIEDYQFIVDLAFERDNTELWANFIEFHRYHHHSEHKDPNNLRCHMRKQALLKPKFMAKWASLNRQYDIQIKNDDRQWGLRHRRGVKRYEKKEHAVHTENIKYINENHDLVEGGRHWGYLVRFSECILNRPEEINNNFGDENIVRNSLRNCFDFIEPEVPNIQELAVRKCSPYFYNIEIIVVAACIETMRLNGNLNSIKHLFLVALKTYFNISYSGVSENEMSALKAEVDRLIFPNVNSAEIFLRQYVEPQLAEISCTHPTVDLLQYDNVFNPLQATLSIEWLNRFDELGLYTLSSLFEIAAQHGDREELNNIILKRCSQLLSEYLQPKNHDLFSQRCKFWFVRACYFLNREEAEPYFNWLKSDKDSVFIFHEYSSRMNRSDHPHWPELTSLKLEAILEAFFDKWPKVYLPGSWGSEYPPEEKAYRFLTDIIWNIGKDGPDEAIPVLNRLLLKSDFSDIHKNLKSIQAEQLRKKALTNFEAPSAAKIVDLLDNNAVITVEGLRQLVIQELQNYQKEIDGGEFNVADRYYTKDKSLNDVHLDEVRSVRIIAERLDTVLKPQNITIIPEFQTKNQNRIDFIAAKVIDGKRSLLVIEAKGQWHPDLYSAASTQLYERYSIHHDAEKQGVYLVIWFGTDVKVAARKAGNITTAKELKESIEKTLPLEIRGFIDVFVLDVSRS
ncbi:ATP-binding protein [Colwellia sp. D2M02]|uniref:NACHT domain-containing protein n=1 Tax=Colwellia sp. D2M02 TaxID=2841562 RepID=UPI001C090011|nr:ATP-binding protein [Colwellia sp. D2M02]MBU2893955.1 ATP-binding protein [Colwellia sp. D2M02]